MDLKQLEYFVRVAELGSFTKAAQALDVAQPALSRQVRLLEVELRQNLLLRNGRGANPTEAGTLLLAHARGILHQVERAREELGRVRGALAGRVAIGLPPSLSRVLAVPLMRAFRQQLPQVSASISEGLSVNMQEWLTNGRLDIAVLYNAQAGGSRAGEPGPAFAGGTGNRRRGRHPRSGGRWRRRRPALAQRGQQLDPAFGLPGARGGRAPVAYPLVFGDQLPTPCHPDTTGGAGAAAKHDRTAVVIQFHSRNTKSVIEGNATKIAVRAKSLATNGRMAR